MSKYYLVKNPDFIELKPFDKNSSCVELTQEDIDTITHDNYYEKSISKFRKVFE